MSGTIDLAKYLKEHENPSPYTPMFGKIISLPDLKIQMGGQRSMIILDADDVKSIFDVYEKKIYDDHTEYVNLNKTIVLLPYSGDNKFIAIGVVDE